MPRIWGKHVKSLGIHTGKNGGSLPTGLREVDISDSLGSVKTSLLHKFSRLSTQPFSTANAASPPLAEYNFYPFSTVPITTAATRKFKER